MSANQIVLSIIVPTCHRNDYLSNCLRHLKPQLDETVEVIVTDDGVRSNAEQLVATYFPQARWVHGPSRGPAANRNAGAKQARGLWLAFLDDDCVPSPDWVRVIKDCINSRFDGVIEGKTIAPAREDSPLKYYVENLSGGVYWSCNLALPKADFWQLGGFDEDFLEAGGEDMEFAWRIAKNKVATRFLPEASVFHPARVLTLKQLWWRTFLIRWKLLYELKTGQSFKLESCQLYIVFYTLQATCVDLLRTGWHLISKHDPSRWKSQLFNQSWKCLTFPLVLPYLIFWELRFREQLRAHSSDSQAESRN